MIGSLLGLGAAVAVVGYEIVRWAAKPPEPHAPRPENPRPTSPPSSRDHGSSWSSERSPGFSMAPLRRVGDKRVQRRLRQTLGVGRVDVGHHAEGER